MITPICPTCGCSLVRLGISKDKAATYSYSGEEYHFCCQGCVDIFVADPQRYLHEISDLIVCPTCLAEKPRRLAAKEVIAGQEVYFCRCPHCVDAFRKKAEYYVKRLEWSDEISPRGVTSLRDFCRTLVKDATWHCAAAAQ